LVVAGVVALIAQTTVIEMFPAWLRPDLPIGVAVWAGLRLETPAALCAAFVLGVVTALYSGIPGAIPPVCYVCAALGCAHSDALLQVDRLITAPLWATIGTVLIGLMVLAAQWLNQPGGPNPALIVHIPVKAALTGATAAIIGAVLDRIAS
jgi:cell shape-determining protein MreD